MFSWMTGTAGSDGLQTSGQLSKEAFIQFAKACAEKFDSSGTGHMFSAFLASAGC